MDLNNDIPVRIRDMILQNHGALSTFAQDGLATSGPGAIMFKWHPDDGPPAEGVLVKMVYRPRADFDAMMARNFGSPGDATPWDFDATRYIFVVVTTKAKASIDDVHFFTVSLFPEVDGTIDFGSTVH